MLEAKSSLSRLVEAVESGDQAEVVIARNGKPAARLVAMDSAATGPRIGAAPGLFDLPAGDVDFDAQVALLFTEDRSAPAAEPAGQ